MIKVYTGEILTDVSVVPLLYPNLKLQMKEDWLFAKGAFRFYTEPSVSITQNPEDADFILVPHNFFHIKDKLDYIHRYSGLATMYKKKILLFAYGDSTEQIDIPYAIILRTSQYKSLKRANEIIMPGYNEDLLYGNRLQLRKKGDKPVVGFCGWADFPNLKSKLKFLIKTLIFDLKRLFPGGVLSGAQRQGMWFRRKALSSLVESAIVNCNFIIRKSYSGHKKTVIGDYNNVRREYIQNILESDLALSIRGDGNFSYRFYEALSLGRIPLLIDTDCPLPLEDIIAYDDFILRVDYRDIEKSAQKAADFYGNISDDEYAQKQRMARDVFEKYLRIDSFFYFLFREEKIFNYVRD